MKLVPMLAWLLDLHASCTIAHEGMAAIRGVRVGLGERMADENPSVERSACKKRDVDGRLLGSRQAVCIQLYESN